MASSHVFYFNLHLSYTPPTKRRFLMNVPSEYPLSSLLSLFIAAAPSKSPSALTWMSIGVPAVALTPHSPANPFSTLQQDQSFKSRNWIIVPVLYLLKSFRRVFTLSLEQRTNCLTWVRRLGPSLLLKLPLLSECLPRDLLPFLLIDTASSHYRLTSPF